MDIKVKLEFTISDIEQDMLEEMTLEDYVRYLMEEDGFDCFLEEGDFEVCDIEIL